MQITNRIAGYALALLAFLPAPAPAHASGTHTVEVMDLQLAMKAALRAILVCNEAGYQVGVSVVDRFGIEQATLRSNMGGAYVTETARRKAWTAAIYNTPETMPVPERISGRQGVPLGGEAPGMLPLSGGVQILSQTGESLGGIGVAGGGGGEIESECAQAGLDAIADQLK